MANAPLRQGGSEALATLEAKPVEGARRWLLRMTSPRPGGLVPVTRELFESASRAGMRKIGSTREGYPVVTSVFDSDVFVDGDGTTQASLSPRGYHFKTFFESGRCILTWNHVPRTPTSEEVESRAGGAGFEADYAAHLSAVRRRTANGETPFVVPDLAAAVTLGRLYYAQMVPLGLAKSVVTRNVIATAVLGALSVVAAVRIAAAVVRVVLRHY